MKCECLTSKEYELRYELGTMVSKTGSYRTLYPRFSYRNAWPRHSHPCSIGVNNTIHPPTVNLGARMT